MKLNTQLGLLCGLGAILFGMTVSTARADLVSGWGLETGFQNATLTEGVTGSFSTTTPTGNAGPRALFTPIDFTGIGTVITLSGSVTLQNAPGNIQFRFGIYDTNGRNTGTLGSGLWSGAQNDQWLGYFAQPRNLADGSGGSIVQGRNATGAWLSGTGAYGLTPDLLTQSGTAAAGSTFDFSLTLERLSASSVGVGFSLLQTAGTGDVNISGSYTDTGTSASADGFNAVGFLLNVNTGSGSFNNVDVSVAVVPEPTVFALSGLGLAALLVIRRNRTTK